MKYTLSIRSRHAALLIFLLAFWGSHGVAEGSSLFQVRWVDDGDTVVLTDGARVRYIGINAPEVAHRDTPAQRFGPEAADFNRKLVHGKMVRLEYDTERKDQYGRVLAYVFLKDGTFVNAALVKSGLAYFVFRRPNTKYDATLLRFQQEAMARRMGMWEALPMQKGPLLGNRHSKRFHRPACSFGKATASRHRVIFETNYDAFRAGYSPCKHCFDNVW